MDYSSDVKKTKSKTAIIRGRPKKPINEPIQQQSPSHIYATIERNTSLDRTSANINSMATQITSSINTTPKQSTFKRIQSLFRPSPSTRFRIFNLEKKKKNIDILAITNSARVNRVFQAKSTVIAFGSSTPTQRIPNASATPSTSTIKKIPSPTRKYNLRTRLFTSTTHGEKANDEVN